jgi:hypothetical protein
MAAIFMSFSGIDIVSFGINTRWTSVWSADPQIDAGTGRIS